MKYEGKMDKECIKICDALNSIPYVETESSCCGHGRMAFLIFLKTDNVRQLFPLMRQLSHNYCNNGWTCELSLSDMYDSPVSYLLHSNKLVGEEAYKSADKMAERIIEYLQGEYKWISEKFGVILHEELPLGGGEDYTSPPDDDVIEDGFGSAWSA
jgi:hypothetical protein